MKMKGLTKVGALFLALVIALAGVGVGFAAWTDSLWIDGYVQTGTVDINILDTSGTIVFKVPGAPDTGYGPETVVWHGWLSDYPGDPPGGIWVADALPWYVEPSNNYVYAEWYNIFPCIDFTVDVLYSYDGTIPVKVNLVWMGGDAWLDPYLTWSMEIVAAGPGSPNMPGDVVTEGMQIHTGDQVLFMATIHLPQDNALQGMYGWAWWYLEVIQWNEYGIY